MNQLRYDFGGSSLIDRGRAPLLERADHSAPSVFRPENMLRESRRQKGLRSGDVPAVCVLDPDGDIVDHVRKQYGATRSALWACYHTRLWEWECGGTRYGIVGYAVGGAFAVLVAEQLFASGCRLLINVASAGQIRDVGPPPYYILVDRALRDEGTSYHYLPPAAFANADPSLIALAQGVFAQVCCRVHTGSTWTTDAPFRETAESIALRRDEGILAVEMEAAALYAFANACVRPVVCLAHVSNRLGCLDGRLRKRRPERRLRIDRIGDHAGLGMVAGRKRKRARLGSSRCGMTQGGRQGPKLLLSAARSSAGSSTASSSDDRKSRIQ